MTIHYPLNRLLRLNCIAGMLSGLFFIVGRWSVGRISGSGEGSLLDQPRLWIFSLMLIVSIPAFFAYRMPSNISLLHPLKSYRNLYISFTLLFMSYMLLSLFWAGNLDMALNKAAEILLLVGMIACLYAWIKNSDAEVVSTGFWLTLVLTTMLLALMALMQYSNPESYRTSVFGGGPIIFGRNMALLFIGSIYFSKRKIKWWIWGPLAGLGLISVVLSGSRGAMFSTFLVILLYIGVHRKRRILKLVLLVALPIIAFLFLQFTPVGGKVSKIIYGRILVQTIEEQHMSGREELYLAALELGSKKPIFGGGLTAFAKTGFSNPYPHNILLEVFDEGGLVGIFLFLSAILSFFVYLLRNRSKIELAMVMAFFLILFASQTSGDIYDSRGIFFFSLFSAIPAFYSIKQDQEFLGKHRGTNNKD